jgi:hypothetical protein
MSIYATLWTLKFPEAGDDYVGCDWIQVTAQGVPAHIGSPTPGCGYEDGDPFASFLPPAIETNERGEFPYMRAVVFVTENCVKGTDRSPQEYASPLLVLTGKEYSHIAFAELHRRLCDGLRGDRDPVVGQLSAPDGSHKLIRGKRRKEES